MKTRACLFSQQYTETSIYLTVDVAADPLTEKQQNLTRIMGTCFP